MRDSDPDPNSPSSEFPPAGYVQFPLFPENGDRDPGAYREENNPNICAATAGLEVPSLHYADLFNIIN